MIQWMQNFEVNKHTIGFKSVSDLPPVNGSALVIDKSMASTKYYEQIDALSDYKGTIIACDRALYSILPYIEQTKKVYVCNLDSSSLCISFFDRPDVKKVMNKVTAVFSVTTNPLTIRHWHGERVFFTPYLGCASLTKKLMMASGTPHLMTGGQVASFAWILALNLGANPLGLFGITNSYDSMGETEFPGARHIRKIGPYGVCWQDPVFEYYNEEFLKFIKTAQKEVKTINTMKAGLLYSPYLEDLSLKEFVKNYG